MGWGGPPAGSPMSAPGATGLPFGGIPPEMFDRVTKLEAKEPEHPRPTMRLADMPLESAQRPFNLRSFLAPHGGTLAIALVLVIIETLASQSGPLLTQLGIDHGIRTKNLHYLWVIAIVYVASVVISVAASGLRLWFTGRFSEILMEQLRIRVFTHLQRLGIDFFTEEKAGRVMTRMTSDIDSLSVLFQDGIVSLAVQALSLLVVTIMLLRINVGLALLTIGVIVPAIGGLTWWFRGASEQGNSQVRDRIADVMADLSESLAGIRIVAAFNRRRHNIEHHQGILNSYRDANVRVSRFGAFYGPAGEAVGIIGQAIVLVVGGHLVLTGKISIGQLTAFLLYLTSFFAPIQQLVQLYTTYQQGQAAAAKLRDLLATAPSVVDRVGAVDLPPVSGRIELRDVTFGYDPAHPVLHSVSLLVEPGEVVAFVGATGAGKSTIAKLVTRFYDPTAGAVLVDGHDLREITIASLRRQLGVVPQEPFLFAGSIRDNIAFARPDATDAEVIDAVRAVGLTDLVARLPLGLDSPCHERGSSLSAGERQLLALARAFMAKPRVLILDEATSNLDLGSETIIERALDVVLEGRTAIIIAHRLATAMRADRIAVIDDGRLVELGTANELIAAEGSFAAMYTTWLQHVGAA